MRQTQSGRRGRRRFDPVRPAVSTAFAAACLLIGFSHGYAQVIEDVAYGPSPAQRMDIYLPPKLDAHAPALIMVHGGAWMVGDKTADDVVTNKAAHWLPKGYVFISVNTRLSPEADPIEQAEDVGRALATAQSMAGSWGGEPGRFVLMGHSSGAHVVSLLAADPDMAAAQQASPWLGTIALDSGAFDIPAIMRGAHMAFYDRVFGSNPEFWKAASPIAHLDRAPAPMLLVCSTYGKASCPQARAFADKAAAVGGRAEVLPVALDHMAINANLGLSGDYTEAADGFLRSLGLP
jgi:arylformamidase